VRALRDIDLAEDAVQEAFVVALDRWPRDGLPENPGAWITAVARNRALDRLRRERRGAEKLEEFARTAPAADEGDDMDEIPDERLSLVFMCCHPALALEARVALTLRLLGGLTTAEIARVSRPGADDGAAARAREAEDPGGRDSVPRAAGAPLAGAARRRPRGAVPRLQRGLLGNGGRVARAAGARGRGDPARAGARGIDV
jgi:RNA polymerase sigma factor (sigma-70 family)